MRCLTDINLNEKAFIKQIHSHLSIRQRLSDLGLIPGTAIFCVGESPFGDPRAYRVRGSTIAIRNRDARHIEIE